MTSSMIILQRKKALVDKILDKYAERPDVSREEVLEVIDDIEELRKQRKTLYRGYLRAECLRSEKTAIRKSRRCVCMWRIPAT